MSLRNAIVRIQTHALSAGAREAPTDPTESNIAFPFAVCYPSRMRVQGESGGGERDLVTVHLDLHVNRQDLPTDVQQVLNFYEAFKPLLIADPTLSGTVDTILMDSSNPIDVTFGEMMYGTVKTVGLRWAITFKQRM